MAKYRPSDVGSLVLDRPSPAGRLWPAFSVASFRRRILDVMRCGASHHRRAAAMSPERHPQEKPAATGEKPWAGSRKKLGSESLLELLNNPEESSDGSGPDEAETRRKMEAFEELRGVVKRLQFEEGEKKKLAAMDVRRLTKADSYARETLAMLGAIPTLVGMLDVVEDSDFQTQALYALLNLGIGNDMNKAAIVKAGAIHKMLKIMESFSGSRPPAALSEAIVANFLGLSALDANKAIIGSSGAILVLSSILQKPDPDLSHQCKQDALRAVFNLSISPSNIPLMVEADLIRFLIASMGDMEVSERALSILSNVVSTPEGRKAVSGAHPEALSILIDVLNWTDSPACQEKVAYILMIMAHKVWWDRQAMIDNGIVSAALELTLLGSTLAQKRASRILECLRVDKGKQVCGSGPAVSAPLCGSGCLSSGLVGHDLGGKSEPNEMTQEEEMVVMSEERRAVKQLVQQSLQNNMRRIVKRANLPQDFAPSDHFKSLTASSTSKSLPL